MKIYQGFRYRPDEKTVGETGVFVKDTAGNTARKKLRHIVKHSPDGFNWGYGGSGPSDLALSILCDFLGNVGSKIPERCWGVDCRHNYCLAWKHHQDFKRGFVARWPQDGTWEITEVEIANWMARQPAAAGE